MTGIVVAGGGLAGGAAACGLALAGREVTLLERDSAPTHKICGEFLSVEAQASLAAIGLDPASLGGHRITELRLVRGDRAFAVTLPFEGLGLTRFRLDSALLDHATALGADVRRGTAIRAITTDHGLCLDLADGSTMTPATLLLATGKHDLRGSRRQAAAPEDLIGFKMYFRLTAQAASALAGHIELHLFPEGYGGLQFVEDGMANLTLLIRRDRFKAAGADWPTLLASLKSASRILDERLAGAMPLLDQPLTIFRVPYGFIHRPTPADPANLFRLGDQAAVIPSFTGDGMAIALHSADRVLRAIRAGDPASAYHTQLRRHVRGQIFRAASLYQLARQSRGQPALFALTRQFPALLRLAARWTRVPQAQTR